MTEREVNFKMDTRKSTRVAFTVPPFDAQVHDWVKNQQNTSLSMRLLIKDHIARYGMGDITALPMMIDESSQPLSARTKAEKHVQTEAAVSVTETAPAPEIRQEIIPEPKPEPVAEPVPKPAPIPAEPVLDLTQAESNANQSEPQINPMLADLMK